MIFEIGAFLFSALALAAILLDSADRWRERFRLRRARDRRAGVGEVPPWPDDLADPDLLEQLDEWWTEVERWERYFNEG